MKYDYYKILGEKYELKAMKYANMDSALHRAINERAELSQYRQADGSMWVRVYSMDCDCAEGVGYRKIPCNWWALEKARIQQDKWAEGPCSLWPVMEPGESWSRDRVMEAYENGSSWSV